MEQLNRNTPPPYQVPEKLSLIPIKQFDSKTGIPVHLIPAGTQPIIRLDIIFQAGTRYQSKLFQSALANRLLVEGTETKDANDIATFLDFYGSYLYPFCDRDEAGLSLFSLERHFSKNLDLLFDVLSHPIYNEKEIALFKAKKVQQLILDKQKPEAHARKQFFQDIFGASHPYGVHGEPADLDLLNQADALEFFKQFYSAEGAEIILTSPKPEEHAKQIEPYLSHWFSTSKINLPLPTLPSISSRPPQNQFIVVPEATQIAIRLGRLIPDRDHPDFNGLNILNTILGGYFGSRLMQNIREDKGYTYGIGSGIVSFTGSSFLTVASNVRTENYQDAIQECFKEFETLRNVPVHPDELERVRNYLVGDLQRQLDGPFSVADSFKALLTFDEDLDSLNQMLQTILTIEPKEIQYLANTYLCAADFEVVAAGPQQ